MSEQRACGILHLHETCEPPCPRKLAALETLPYGSPVDAVNWRIPWDPDGRRGKPQGWLEHADGSIAQVCADGTVVDAEPTEDEGDDPA
ncbi:hypothetical protein OHB12_23015 [Nocardia sp. NBC_01730]|uniref:hypothetical protein n=1 Tax=Nocardia sp. NBC_01730 TaxID=2975998 RepID=UPI002E0FB979|nr:hypothetical protein OHB12_23015 [Nocardia sp. NBC_01730]